MMKNFGFLLGILVVSFGNGFSRADYTPMPVTEYVVISSNRIVKLEDGLDFYVPGQPFGVSPLNTYEYLQKSGIGRYRSKSQGLQIHRQHSTLKDINFSQCVLENADFLETSFEDCNFSESYLVGAMFSGYLTGCNFSDASINGATFGGLSAEQLKSTSSYKRKDLSGTRFYCPYSEAGMEPDGADFSNVDFSDMDLSNTVFECVRLENCIFANATIKGTHFSAVNSANFMKFLEEKNRVSYYDEYAFKVEQLLDTKDFQDGFVEGLEATLLIFPEDQVVDFACMSFINCTLGSIKDAKLDLTDSVISGCDFTAFQGLTLENVKSTWNYEHSRMEGIKLPESIQKVLDAEKEK